MKGFGFCPRKTQKDAKIIYSQMNSTDI